MLLSGDAWWLLAGGLLSGDLRLRWRLEETFLIELLKVKLKGLRFI